MGKIDPRITAAMVAWLQEESHDEESIQKGAELLLRVNRNQGLYQRIMRNPLRSLSKLEYEIKKHVNIRQQGFSVDDIVKMEHEVLPGIKFARERCDLMIEEQKIDESEVLPHIEKPNDEHWTELTYPVKGKRPDHDRLPAEIQAIWPENAERWKKIKATFELCKQLDQPCDRFEHVKMLKEAWYKYKERMAQYDDFVLKEKPEEKPEDKKVSEDKQKDIDYAQSFISKNLPVLMGLVKEAQEPDFSEEDAAKLEEKRAFIQNRVNILLQNGVNLSEQRKADLIACDIAVELTENVEGEKPE